MSKYIGKKEQKKLEEELKAKETLNNLKLRLQAKSNTYKSDIEKGTSDDLFWYGPPVSPREFIEGKDYYNSQGEIYPWIVEDLEEIFSGEFHAPKYHTAVILAGTGSGKAYLAGFTMAYMWYWLLSFKSLRIYFKDYLGCTWGDDATVAFFNMAPDAKIAKKVVFDRVVKILTRMPTLRERGWLPDPEINSEMLYREYNSDLDRKFDKITVMPGNSSRTITLSHSVFGGVIDEACFWETKMNDPVEELYKTMDDRRSSRFGESGLILLISSAYTEGNYAEQLAAESLKNPKIYHRRRSRYECKPEFFGQPTFQLQTLREKLDGTVESITLNPPISLKEKYERDKDKALRDIDAIPSVAGQPFYPDFELLLSKINKHRFDPAPDKGKSTPESPMDIQTRLLSDFRGKKGCKHRIHVDLAKGNVVDGNCGCGFAMVHKQADPHLGIKVVLDLAVRFKAPSGKEIDIGELLNFIKWLKTDRDFDIEMVTFDKHNSMQPIQTIQSWGLGIEADKLSVQYQEHTYLKNLINSGQFDFYFDQNLLFELKRLEDYQNAVLPGVNSYKDESDAVAGAAFSSAALEPSKDKLKAAPPRVNSPQVVSRGGAPGNNSLGQYRNISGIPRYRRNMP